MALKDFDYKQFLLDRGERVGLYAAGGLGGLLIFLSLVWPGKALFNASPRPAANELAQAAKDKNNRVQTAAPSESEKTQLREVPAELMKDASSVAEDPDNYRIATDIFAPRDIQTTKRRLPNVLTPDQFQAAFVSAQVNNYVVKEERGTLLIGVLTERKTGSKPGKPGTDFTRNLGNLGNLLGGGGNKGGGGMAGGLGGRGGPPGMPGMGGLRGSGGMGGPGSGAGSIFGGGDEKKNQQVNFVTKEDLAKMPSPEFARDLEPVPMAIVAGSFPFRAQVEEFEKALRIQSAYQVVVDERVKEKDKKGHEVDMPAFRFIGFKLRRRNVGPDGKPQGEFKDLDFVDPYRGVMATVLNESAPEDAKVQQLLYPGLFQPRPVQIPVKGKDNEHATKAYPDFEPDLPRIKDELTELNPQQKAPVVGKSPFDKNDDFNPFGGQNAPAAAETDTTPAVNQQWEPAKFCVLRFIDVTVKPGETYEYQIQVRMANPNLNRPASDVAYPDLANPKAFPDIHSDWCDVKGPDGNLLQVSVPTDLHYYAVDEQALAKAEKKEYRGMNANKTHDASKQAVVQIHRWMDRYEQTRGNKTEFFPIGDWVVGERLFIYRGESLAAKALTHVPIWSYEQSTFALAGRPPVGVRDKRPTENVTFFQQDRNRAPLLVDFEGGSASYLRKAVPAATSEDGTPEPGAKATPAVDIRQFGTAHELLFLTPDGKLVVRDSAHDENDEDRKTREQEYTERVDEASGKSPAKPQVPPKPEP
jgi:hypothetical protein